MIDWSLVIKSLQNGSIVSVDPLRWNLKNPQYKKILDLWKTNNFNTNAVRWINYYEYGDIENQISSQLNIKPLRSWISCVEPGYMTGYHYDVDDNEEEYLKFGELQRFSIFIGEPDVGQIFILGNQYHFNKPQGTILKWNHHREWHNGINGGLKNKYMFHIIGY